MKKILPLFVVILLFASITSCEKNIEAEIPSYLSIGEITVKDTSGKVISSDASDAWVYINDRLKGSFQLPTKLPILEDGQHRVDIRAGVKENGIYDLKVIYPFYTVYSKTIDFKDEKVNHIDPVVSYTEFAEVNKTWTGADFEGGINFNEGPTSDTVFVQTPNNTGNPVYGNSVGTYYLTDANPFFVAYTDEISNIPRNSPEIWMEMDYISDVHVTVGVSNGNFSDPRGIVTFKPQVSWTKVYIKLATGILPYPAPSYQIFISSEKGSHIPTSVTSIDNVKLLHF